MSTIKSHIELEVDIDYDHSPDEPDVNHVGGCDINSVMVGGTDVLGELSGTQVEALEEYCIEQLAAVEQSEEEK